MKTSYKYERIYNRYIKRVFDLFFSFFLLILFLPFMVLIGILIILIDHIFPIYTQIRTGKDGKNIKIFKFRTMKDHEITRFGVLLRRFSIDEFPQIINVFLGSMSLVGPRPWIVEYYERFNMEQKRRVLVKPGIVGLAQINGRNKISIHEKISYDLEYVSHVSFLLDFSILLKSIFCFYSDENDIHPDDYIQKELMVLDKNCKKKIVN